MVDMTLCLRYTTGRPRRAMETIFADTDQVRVGEWDASVVCLHVHSAALPLPSLTQAAYTSVPSQLPFGLIPMLAV
jgi:hypothetical protein